MRIFPVSLSKRELLLAAMALREHATHSIGDPLGRRDSEQLAKYLEAQLSQLPKEQ